MADMFGGPVGTSAYDKDFREAVHVGSQAVGTLAHARLFNAEAAAKEQEAEQQKQLAAFAQSAAGGAGVSGVPGEAPTSNANPFALSSFFNQQSVFAAKKGMTKLSQELAKTASTLTQQEASTLSSNTTARLNQLKIIGERSELMGQMFGAATDQSSWDRSNALFEFQTGQPSPYRGVQFNPALAQTIREQALTVKERLAAEDRKMTRENTQEYRDARLTQHDANISIAQARLGLERAREARLEKAGGKGAAGAPTTEERLEVKRLMRLSGIDTDKVDSDSLGSTAFAVASRARELQQENRALGRQAAITRAFTEMKANGDLDLGEGGGVVLPILGRVGGKAPKFERKADLPAAARSALKEGHETTFTNGQVWTLEGGKATRVK